MRASERANVGNAKYETREGREGGSKRGRGEGGGGGFSAFSQEIRENPLCE